MFFSPSWLTLIGSTALAFTLGGGIGFFQGLDHEREKANAALVKAQARAREIESDWQVNAQALQEVHDDELRQIHAQHLRDLDGVRNRPGGRLPPTASCTADGAGATGAQLSGPDAAAFERLAADADAVAADLRACQAWVTTVTRR